jgi:hypothetical protein
MSVRSVVTRKSGRNLVHNCRTVSIRVDRHLPGGPVQSWMRTIWLTRNAKTNRQIISDGIQDLRNRIRATAILA